MISLLNGQVRAIHLDRAIIEVGGVGFSVLITGHTSAQLNLGAQIQLFTSLIVREDSLTLFGFPEEESRDLFELVQTVSGIGPKVALSLVGAITPDRLAHAIAQEDIAAISQVPGIGRKGAQRMILELAGKLTNLAGTHRSTHHQPLWREQLASALVSLGFSAKDSDAAITTVVSALAADGIDAATLELSELLKSALQSGRRS